MDESSCGVRYESWGRSWGEIELSEAAWGACSGRPVELLLLVEATEGAVGFPGSQGHEFDSLSLHPLAAVVSLDS